MTKSDSFIKYNTLLHGLAFVIYKYGNESKEADHIRDKMDSPYKLLTDDERLELDGISEGLSEMYEDKSSEKKILNSVLRSDEKAPIYRVRNKHGVFAGPLKGYENQGERWFGGRYTGLSAKRLFILRDLQLIKKAVTDGHPIPLPGPNDHTVLLYADYKQGPIFDHGEPTEINLKESSIELISS